MGFFSYTHDHLRLFRHVLVHPSQEMRDPDGAFFRGGPEWPRFGAQVLARHCRGWVPRPVDLRPLPALPEWPYFAPEVLPVFWPQLGIDPQLPTPERRRATARLADALAPLPAQTTQTVDAGLWCGPINLHFGHMISDFGMRIAGSNRFDDEMPLVFSLPPFRNVEPPPHFWGMLDHLGVDRRRVLLVRKPTRFDRLYVVPQAERPYGGGPHPRHLRLLDATPGAPGATDADVDVVFVSRARLADGRFAGESHIDETLAATGVTVFHPETTDLAAQLLLYRRARVLIFSEGSALHALQLLGHVAADLIVLVRRPGSRLAAASLRPRVRSLQYLPAARGLIHGMSPSGHPIRRAGISILDEAPFLAGLGAAGINLAKHWDSEAHARRRDADIAAWAAQRQTAGRHPGDQALVERGLRALSLPV